MMPASGLHVALGAALILRGSFAAAAAPCLLIANPLVHAVESPLAHAIGRRRVAAGHAGPGG